MVAAQGVMNMVENRVRAYEESVRRAIVSDYGREQTSSASGIAKRLVTQMEKQISKRPAVALGVGVAIGVLLGCLVKRR